MSRLTTTFDVGHFTADIGESNSRRCARMSNVRRPMSDVECTCQTTHWFSNPIAALRLSTIDPASHQIIPIHTGDDFQLDILWADGFAFPDVRAAAEHFLFDLSDHLHGAVIAFRLAVRQKSGVADLRAREESGRCVGASGHAGAATDAGGGIHGQVRSLFGDGNRIAVGCASGRRRNEAAAGDDAVEGASIHDQVLDDRESASPPRLQVQNVAVLKVPHVELAHRDAAPGTVGDAIDHETAGAADALRSEEHTSELQSPYDLVCRLLLE